MTDLRGGRFLYDKKTTAYQKYQVIAWLFCESIISSRIQHILYILEETASFLIQYSLNSPAFLNSALTQ